MSNQTIDGVPRELLPCPLCASDKISLAWDVYDTDRGRRTQSQITCLGCRLLTKTFKSHAEARAYWNNRAAQPQGEPVVCMPVERCYDVRAKMIIAFNHARQNGGDLDDALDAAYKSALRFSPYPA